MWAALQVLVHLHVYWKVVDLLDLLDRNFGLILSNILFILVNIEMRPGRQVAVNAQQYTVLVMDVPDFVAQRAKLLRRAQRSQWLWRTWYPPRPGLLRISTW